MKMKRLIFGVAVVFVLVIAFMCQTVLAVEEQINPARTFTELSVNSVSTPGFVEYGLGTSGPAITQIGDENFNRLKNYYCGKADIGFENRTGITGTDQYIDQYSSRYKMNDLTNKDAISYLYDSDTYDKILSLTNLFYLGESDDADATEFINYIRPLVKKYLQATNPHSAALASDEAFNEYFNIWKNNGYINPEQIRAIQQAAIWYYTNGGEYDKTGLGEDNSLLYFKTTISNTFDELNVEETQKIAKFIYNDFITTTNDNTVAPMNDVYLYVDNLTDDEQPIIEIKPKLNLDLALRKFIVKVTTSSGTDRVFDSREPIVSSEEQANLVTQTATYDDGTTAQKVHQNEAENATRKTPLSVAVGDTVRYKIRVYNEGNVLATAGEVTDYLPEGLDFKTYTAGDGSINDINGWQADGRKITTDKLKDSMIAPCDGELHYLDLEIECIVNGNSDNLMNIAEISEYRDSEGEKDVDIDSGTKDDHKVTTNTSQYHPTDSTKGRGEEDDDDYEDLKLLKPDLALRKYIIKVENSEGTEVQSAEALKDRNPNVDNKIDTSTIYSNTTTATYKHKKYPVTVKEGDYVYYNITVYNEGDINGYAKQITDKLPSGVRFVEIVDADNSKYVVETPDYIYDENNNIVSGDGILVLKRKDSLNAQYMNAFDGTTLANETVTIKCKVTADKEADKNKIFTNIAWISQDSFESSSTLTDKDSSPVDYPQENTLVTEHPDMGYIGNSENNSKDLTSKDEYFKGLEDDDDFEKIIIYSTPDIHKGVKTVENQDSGYYDNEDNKIDENEKHAWVINSTLPIDIAEYLKYTITDDVDYRLVYGELKEVNIIDYNGNKLEELQEGTDFIYEYTPNTEHVNETSAILGEKYVGTIKLTFIDVENNKNISEKLANRAGNMIEVKFTTTFAKDENGKLKGEVIGVNIPNKAKLAYKNGANTEGEDESEKPEVHTGGVTLFKYYNAKNQKVGLENAEFEVYDNKEAATRRANEVNGVKTSEASENATAVEPIQTVKSDKNGLVKFRGLQYGEDAKDHVEQDLKGLYIQGTSSIRDIPATKYWIVETKAPKHFEITVKEPIEVNIDKDSYKTSVETVEHEVENRQLIFDLALRKFITKVNDKDVTDRVPQVKYKDGKITYEHTKEPVDVVNSNVVTYTLRIFNEGEINGYANIITDDVPEGLLFLPDNETNKTMRWVMYERLADDAKDVDQSKVVECDGKKYIETNDATKAAIIRTDYLSKEQGELKMKAGDTQNPNLLKAFDKEKGVTDANPDYRDIQVAFKVIEPNGSKNIIINYAQISDDKDEDNNEVDDIDSTPNEWIEGEDDQDIEKIKLPIFDLALRKWVTQAIVIENGQEEITETGHDAWDDPEEIVKVDLHRRKLSDVTVKFRYYIRIYNEGEIEGYCKEITDYIPEGLKFVAEDNPGWVDEGNNVISTRLLEGRLLKPGEYDEVEVVLTWINGADNLGLKVNVAEISEDYNEKGVPDKDSTPDNRKPDEDDIDDAPVMLSIETGSESTIFIIIGTLSVLTIAAGAIIIKKFVL